MNQLTSKLVKIVGPKLTKELSFPLTLSKACANGTTNQLLDFESIFLHRRSSGAPKRVCPATQIGILLSYRAIMGKSFE